MWEEKNNLLVNTGMQNKVLITKGDTGQRDDRRDATKSEVQTGVHILS